MRLQIRLSTLTLLGSLAFALAEQEAGMEYLKCVSAVVKSTTFHSCASSYQLDCFCETNVQLEAANAKPNARNGLTLASASTAPSASAPWVQLAPEVGELRAKNGVPTEEIAEYLCDHTTVSASSRRGSIPMVRMGQKAAEEDASTPQELLLEREVAIDNEDDDDDEKENEDSEGCMAKTKAIYEILTVIETRIVCSCAKTATLAHSSAAASSAVATSAPTNSTSTDDDDEEENNTRMNMSGAMHGTQIAVAILPTPSQMSATHAAEFDVSALSARGPSLDGPVLAGLNEQQKHKVHDMMRRRFLRVVRACLVFLGGLCWDSLVLLLDLFCCDDLATHPGDNYLGASNVNGV